MQISGKINLYLTVGHERPSDHRHEIKTLFLPAPALTDQVSVTRTDTPGITCLQSGRNTGCDPQDNLCVKAARAYCDYFGFPPDGLTIHLEKHIPVSAGFGGGSADAAAVLLQLNEIFKENGHSAKDLSPIAVQLGADVSYFLNARPSIATGVGDALTPVAVAAPYRLVIAYPKMPSPVRWAYRHWFRPTGAQPPPWEELKEALADGDIRHLARFCWNDLAFALERKYPMLAMIRLHMTAHGALAAAVSGSGSGVFALCRDDDCANALRIALKNSFPTIEIF